MSRLNLKSARGPQSFVSRQHPRSSLDKRTCVSAPTQATLDQIDDWDWKAGHAVNATNTLAKPDELWNDHLFESGHIHEDNDTGIAVEAEIAVVAAIDKPSRGHAGDFRDYIDPSSSDSGSDAGDDVDADEPYEYWEKAWSYSRSPFSHCSSLSFEESGDEEVKNGYESDSFCVAVDAITPESLSFNALSSRAKPIFSRCSDTSISLTHRWTRMMNGAANFHGSTSI